MARRVAHPIEVESLGILRSRHDFTPLPPLSRAVAERVCHASADLSFADSLVLDEEATVKVFRQRDGHTWLLPRNSNFEPILGDYAQVLGKVVAVLRAV